MVDRVSAWITLGGSINPAVWANLKTAIADEGLSTDWGGEPFDEAERIDGQALELCAEEVAYGRFTKLEELCHRHGVPFVRSCNGYDSQWGAERVVFTGTGEPVTFPIGNDGNPYVDRTKIAELGSLEAVETYLDAADFAVPPLVVTAEEASHD
ncbi:hypothetical protein B2G71_19660 [Novosphingobium sp. PC22D]|jgi:hypothetical protein|uniref:Uncharacterized protein n=2 Tax=Novosphingobium TaxID=165696 RepID=A0ABQ2JWH2_9SPHN|nr:MULTISPECIES: hypothetical protein [Novosphingobium]MCJ2180173.1 hypothetical protein [Novosphingobium album (ex Hu et al. 2023)]PEQ11028.1 hypothetical protein B2G71_19660 [Novosphingobium sp. PC22D]GGN55587.1 hypothetical protein GCM10011349_32420 [Novosphingobium indicum]